MWLFMHVFWMLYSATVSNELVCNPWLYFSSEITSMSGWSMFRRWCLSIRHFCTCQHSSLLEALSQASSHFNVDVQKLLFICFVLILVRIGLVGLCKTEKKREAGLLPANIKMFMLCLAQSKPLTNITMHFIICISICHEKWKIWSADRICNLKFSKITFHQLIDTASQNNEII